MKFASCAVPDLAGNPLAVDEFDCYTGVPKYCVNCAAPQRINMKSSTVHVCHSCGMPYHLEAPIHAIYSQEQLRQWGSS